MDTYTRKTTEIVSYAHKKFGSIDIKIESNKTKIEILDIIGANPPKRIKVEALKYGSQRSYRMFNKRYGRSNVFQNIFHYYTTPPSLWFKPQQPNVKLNNNQFKIPTVSTAYSMYLSAFNSINNSSGRNGKVHFKPTTAQHRIIFPHFPNTKHTAAASICMFFPEPTQNEQDSTTPAKETPNENNDNIEEEGIGEAILEASSLQRKEGLVCTPRHRFLNAQSTLISNMPQGVLKLLGAQESSPKFPFVKISRPSPLLCKKLKERQLYIKLQNSAANVNMDTKNV